MFTSIPVHLTRTKDFGKTVQGGGVVFGFYCEKCKSQFRRDCRSINEFDKSANSFQDWVDIHGHKSDIS